MRNETQQIADRGDCSIIRDHADFPRSTVLMNCDGDILQWFDKSTTDCQIWRALDFANKAYSVGYRAGENSKIRAIKRELRLD